MDIQASSIWVGEINQNTGEIYVLPTPLNRNGTHPFDFPTFVAAKAELSKDGNALQALLKENTARAVAAIQALPDADLGIEVAMPWGTMTLAQIISYPYWNMSYHEGQINYIASILGCLT